MEPKTIIRQELNRFADKLLDLSKRNKMINSNFQLRSKVHFKIIDEIPDLLYRKLKEDMEFKPLPPLDNEPTDENTHQFKKEIFIAKNTDQEYIKNIQSIEQKQEDNLNEAHEKVLRQLKDRVRIKLGMPSRSTKDTPIEEHCKKYGLDPNFDLLRPDDNSKNNPKWNDKKIQTLMLPDTLNKYMDSIYKKYNFFIKETGVNPLFFCFGFLEWTESQNSDHKFYSPILIFQAVLNKKKRKNFSVSGAGNELNINQALNEKLKRDFSIELPELKETEDNQIDIYLEEVRKKISVNHNWKVKNWVSFGLYPNQNMVIFKDMRLIAESETTGGPLEKILLGKISGVNGLGEYNIDDIKYQKEISALIESADASQHSAILDVLKGKDIVIKGPPGTGKSQTIVNIISSLISKGKKVLFVAQKQAALDVVKNKLQANGLDNYILEVFSIKANKKNVIESIKYRLHMDPPFETSQNFETKSKKFYEIKKNLNSYSDLMSKKFKNTEFTAHDIIWRYKPSEELRFFEIKNVESISEDTIKKHIRDLNGIKKIYQENNLKSLKENPFYRIKKLPFSHDKFHIFKNKIDSLYERIKSLLEKEQEILNLNKNLEGVDESFFDHPLIKKWFNLDKGKRENYLEILKIIFLTDSEKLKQIFKAKKEYHKLLEENKLHKNNMKYFKLHNHPDLNLIKDASEILRKKTIFSFFSHKHWKAKKLLKGVYFGKEKRDPASLLENYYKYLKNYPTNEKRKQELKKIMDDLFEKIKAKTYIQNPESILLKENYNNILLMIANSKKLDFKFKQSLLKKPDSLDLYKDLIQKQKNFIDDFKQVLQAPDIEIKFEQFGFKNIAPFFEEIKNNKLSLKKYKKILNAANNINEELKYFYEDFIKSGRNIEFIDKDYNYSIKKSHKDILETECYQELDFYASNHKKFREELISQDQSIMSSYRKVVSKNCYEQSKNALEGVSAGRVKDKTEMSLIHHIDKLNNPRISLRDYFNRAYHSITSLKPCTLMSPLSVSQVLPLNIKYDTLIIDEASQMKPEYSMASIVRANQIVIVGDQKQLPPTDFFQKSIEEEEDEEDNTGESILDMALTVLQTPRDLRWHYRSRHESLIKFSNEKFYDGRLIIPIVPDIHNQHKGVKNIYIQEGVYRSSSSSSRSGGFNEVEAKKVVYEIIKFMKERPKESLGVVAVNRTQKELIENQFDIDKEGKPHIEKYLNSWSQKDEGLNEFFIKNLENVQGDERDVIFISTVYGPDEIAKKVFQRFGPITGKYGHRRLNVLFTRAKNQLVLFTSLKPSDIQVSDKSLEGVKILKEYLSYSETGKLPPVGRINSEGMESPFQQWAVDQIESFPGFSADWEIGVKGYRIDIGVKHKDYHHGYIMAVETDGANYHSTKSARDRDKLRQEILESYGWKFHRIWSTDWLQDPIGVKEKLKKVLEDRLKELNLKI